MSKKKDFKNHAARTSLLMEEVDLGYRELMNAEHFNQWQVSEHIVEHLLDKTMTIVKDKEIARKVPCFSIVSTMSTMKKAIDLKEFEHD